MFLAKGPAGQLRPDAHEDKTRLIEFGRFAAVSRHVAVVNCIVYPATIASRPSDTCVLPTPGGPSSSTFSLALPRDPARLRICFGYIGLRLQVEVRKPAPNRHKEKKRLCDTLKFS
ncbi:hypothetical protein ACVWXO_000867 [Bradyrhizobium sp. LM2.7]